MIAGTYAHEKNDGLKDFIIANGISADFAEKSDAVKSTLVVSQNGNSFTILTKYTDKEVPINFTIGQEFDDPMPNGEQLKSVPSLSGNVITIKSKKDGAEIGHRTYEFNATHCIISMHSATSDKVAKRYFKRA